MNRSNLFLPVLLITIFFDQSSKFLASILGVNIIYNTGISFSKFSQGDPKLLTFMLMVLVCFLFTNFKKYWKENSFAAGLFFGGAVANIFDRLLFNAVRDWIHIPFTQIHNNFADWAIFIGLVLMVSHFLKDSKV